MNIRAAIFLLFFILIVACDSQNNIPLPDDNYFVKFYGEDGDHEGVDFVVNSDGSFFLLGNKIVPGDLLDQQVYIVKVDPLGNVIWQRSFGSVGDDFARDIELTPDGKIIFAAESQKGINDKDVYIKTLTLDGAPLDSIRVGLKTLTNQEANEEVNSISIIQNGFIVSGSTTAVKTQTLYDKKDALHLLLTNSLTLIDPVTGLWKNTSGLDDSEDVLLKIYEINPSMYYGFGYTNTMRKSSRDYKYWAFSLGPTGEPTNNGVMLLDSIGSALDDEKLSGVIESPIQSGEGFVLSGIKTKTTGESQSFIVKLQKTLFVPGEDNVLAETSPTDLGNLEVVNNVQQDVVKRTRMTSSSQGGFLLLTNSNVLSNDKLNISLIKLSNTYLKEWQEPIFFGGVGDDFAGSVTELPDGKIMIMGTMTLGGVSEQRKMVLMKLNSDGKLRD